LVVFGSYTIEQLQSCEVEVGGVDVTEETFERDVIEASGSRPVVVDFWAEWCGPCHALAPVLERAVTEHPGVTLAKVNVDENPGLAARYGISGIPAVKAFRNGAVVSEFVGAQPPVAVAEFIGALTGPSPLDEVVAELRESGAFPEVLPALERGDLELALRVLLEEVGDAEGDRRDGIRRLMVLLFDELGPEHPLTLRYRRRLATALY
jgi:thioredoxin